jgi:hypothetical protein
MPFKQFFFLLKLPIDLLLSFALSIWITTCF